MMPSSRRIRLTYVALVCLYLYCVFLLSTIIYIDPRLPIQSSSFHDIVLRSHRNNYSGEVDHVQKSHGKPGTHRGVELARNLATRCANFVKHPDCKRKVWHVDKVHKIAYCPVEKIGSTFWRRVFFMTLPTNEHKFKSPYEVPIFDAIEQSGKAHFSVTLVSKMNAMAEVFLFVREPYSRLLSAYIDKLVAPNPFYWNGIGSKAISLYRKKPNGGRYQIPDVTGHDVTFTEFVRFARDYETIGRADDHVVSIHRTCRPCYWNYTFVGKMEHFKDDAFYILERMGHGALVGQLGDSFAIDRVKDSVTDSVESVFGWKTNITKVMTWEKALKRVWLKLQLQGIISAGIEFRPSTSDWNMVTARQMVNMALHAHQISKPSELRRQKEQVKREAFSTVPLRHVHRFRERFLGDFVLFDYDDSPDFVFKRDGSVHISLFNYTHLN